jgi:hypothetical protein
MQSALGFPVDFILRPSAAFFKPMPNGLYVVCFLLWLPGHLPINHICGIFFDNLSDIASCQDNDFIHGSDPIKQLGGLS